MRRREFIALAGGAAAALPLSARAQRKPMQVVGVLSSTGTFGLSEQLTGIGQGLRDAGFVEGQDFTMLRRGADGVYDRLPGMAAELVAAKVDVIIAQAPPAARAAKAATTTIPIVFGVGVDPVAEGLVASLARPGGNLTGATLLNSELMTKRLSLMTELVPEARRYAVLMNPRVPNPWMRGFEETARAKGVQLLILEAGTKDEIDAAFVKMVQERTEALVIGEDTFLSGRPEITDLALRNRIPTMGLLRGFAEIGGLATYGTSLTEAYRLVGALAGRILRGAKPGDLAVQRPTKFEMVINLKTAKALGLTISPLMLAQADELIE